MYTVGKSDYMKTRSVLINDNYFSKGLSLDIEVELEKAEN